MGDFSILALRIKELRKNMHKTQAEFAEYVGCTAATLSAYENGAKSPSLEIVKNIAEKCHVSMDWLCGIDTIKNETVENYGELLKYLIKAFNNQELDVHIYEPPNEPWRTDINLYFSLTENIEYTALFKETLDDWLAMRNLLFKEAIKQDVFDLWLEDSARKFSGYKIAPEIPF